MYRYMHTEMTHRQGTFQNLQHIEQANTQYESTAWHPLRYETVEFGFPRAAPPPAKSGGTPSGKKATRNVLVHACMYLYTCMYIRVYIYLMTYTMCSKANRSTNTSKCVSKNVYACTHICVCMYIHLHVHIDTCIYIK